MQEQKFCFRINKNLLDSAKQKAKNRLDLPLSSLIKMFLTSFVNQRGVGFYVGDEDLCHLFNRWIHKKRLEKYRKGCAPLPGPKLKDLFDL